MGKTVNLDDAGLVAALRAACDEIAAMLPENGVHVSTDVYSHRSYAPAIRAAVHVSSKMLGENGGYYKGETFSEAFANARADIRLALDDGRAKRVRKMALAIIEITADHDACTDAHLRTAGFDAAVISDLHAEASEQANAMTDGRSGTYAVQFVGGSNARGES